MRRTIALLLILATAAVSAHAATTHSASAPAATASRAAAASRPAAASRAAAVSPRVNAPRAATGPRATGLAVRRRAAAASRPAVSPRAAAPPRGGAVVSADARLDAGRSVVLLRVARLGRFSASCSVEGLVSVVFVAARLLPTSDLVVARTVGAPLARRVDPGERVVAEAPAGVLMERWQVAPFAAAQVRVTVANVAGRSVEGGCSASVLVTTGPDQGPTIT